MVTASNPSEIFAPASCPRVVLPDISRAFYESPRPVLMPESYLLDLIAHASEEKICIQPRYSPEYRTQKSRRQARHDLLWMFFAHRAPIGFLQDFLLELIDYDGVDTWMIRLKGALEEFMREEEYIDGRTLGQSMVLLEALRKRERNPSLDQIWAGHHSLLAEYFMGAALLWRLRRDELLSPRDEELLADLSVAASVDESRCDLITQILRLQCLPWRDAITIVSYDPPTRGQKKMIPVLDTLIDLFWGDLNDPPTDLKRYIQPDESPEELRRRLRDLLREVAALDVSAHHVLNPGFAFYPPKEMNLAFVRSVGRDGVNTFILVVMKGDRVERRSLVPTHIHPTVRDFRLKPVDATPRSIEEMAAPWHNLEDARLDIFLDSKDDRYKILLTYVVANGGPMPLLESTTIDVERLLEFMDHQPTMEVPEWAGMEMVPQHLRTIETQHAELVVSRYRERRKNNGSPPDSQGVFVTDPVHPLLVSENQEKLLALGLPRAVYEDPEATVKDAARTRQTIRFGGELREVDIWEFRSKKGGDEFMGSPLFKGRYQNPEPSWIGRVALDTVTSEIVAVPVMWADGEWKFRPYLISEDRFAWIGGSSQREIVEMRVPNPKTGREERLKFGMNVIHTTEEVPIKSLPLWLQPTKPKPYIPIFKYELRLTLELNPWDPFAEPILYGGVAATPRRLDDWVGWVGRVKFNNNFSVRTIRAVSREGEPAEERRIFEFLMAGGDHVVQHAWCDFDTLRPLELPWNERGELEMPPLTPFINPQTGERYHIP